ncbi:MAG: hypothetical protein KAY37_05110 [Phycisphaerae bacterium]|nr:hypothetical protein [Phycisphaerae bacterium]
MAIDLLCTLVCRGHFVMPHHDFFEFIDSGHAWLCEARRARLPAPGRAQDAFGGLHLECSGRAPYRPLLAARIFPCSTAEPPRLSLGRESLAGPRIPSRPLSPQERIPVEHGCEKGFSHQLQFLLLSTRTPAVAEFTGPDGGKTAHYMLRWLSTRGEAGPWSETASATIEG